MAEQLLDRPQVGAPVEEVSGEGVAQGVRRGPGGAGDEAQALQAALHRARAEPAAARRQEERASVLRAAARVAQEWAQGQVGVQGEHGLAAQRHHALLATLAVAYAHQGRAVDAAVDVGEIEAAALRHAQAGAVEHLEHGAVPGGDLGVAEHVLVVRVRRRRLDQAEGVVDRERARQGPPPSRRAHQRGRVVGGLAPLHQEAEERAQARQLARHRGGVDGAKQRGKVSTHHGDVNARGLRVAAAPLGVQAPELVDVVQVGRDGARGRAALDLEVAGELAGRLGPRPRHGPC